MKKVFAYIVVVVISAFNYSLFGMKEHNPLCPSTTNRTYVNDIQDNLPLLAQPDAEEFCEQMKHSFTSLFPNSNDIHVRAWGDFFKSVIIQGKMGIRTSPYEQLVDMDAVLMTISDVPKKPTKQSKELAVLFLSVSEKNRYALEVHPIDIFFKKLYAIPAFKTLKKQNSYALFMDGFLDLIQGVQYGNLQKKQDGEYKLVLSAYSLNELALKVLKAIELNNNKKRNISKKHEILLKPIDSKILENCIKEQYFLEGEESPFINPLGENQHSQYQMIRKKMYEQLIDVYHQALSDEKQTLYVDINEYLRDKLLERRDAVSLYSTISWKLSVVVPFILDLATPIMNIIAYEMIASEDNTKTARNIIITGCIIAFIMPFVTLAQGIYQWWNSLGTVLYSEDQIQIIALYYSMVYEATYKTAGGIVQPFIDYLDAQNNKEKTLTQHTIDFKIGKK